MTLSVETARTIDELDSLGSLDDKTTREFKHKTCNAIFKSVTRLYETANLKNRQGNKLEAYVLFSRTGALCMIIQNLASKKEFSKTPEGKDYISIFTIICSEVEKLKPCVRQILEDKRMAIESEKDSKLAQTMSVSSILDKPTINGEFILPKDLVSYALEGKKILILDYRSNTKHCVSFPEPNMNTNGVRKEDARLHDNITVAQCPPFCIESSVTLVQLPKVIPIRERLKVENMGRYDLVVFMDEEDPKTNKDGKYQPPANYLKNALTVYAHNQRLKRDPVFMKGGFLMWDYTYPLYTTKDHHESVFKDNDDEFGNMLNEYKNMAAINVQYPDLIKHLVVKEPPWPSHGQGSAQPTADVVKFRQTPIPGAEPMRLPPKPPSPENTWSSTNPFATPDAEPAAAPKTTSTSPVTVTSFSTTPDAPPVTRITPTVDRTTKPPVRAAPNPPNLPPPKSVFTPQPAVEALGGANPVEFQQLPINGYTRAEPSSQIGFDSFAPQNQNQPPNRRFEESKKEPILPPRPPVPDRSTKVPAMSQEEEEHLLKIYDRAYNKLWDRASKGRPEYGVGFINMGNTCFMNTTLQALINTPGMRSLFNEDKFAKLVNCRNRSGTSGLISAVFSALMDVYWSGKAKVLRPEIFLHTFADHVNRSMADRRQHDAQEFQIYLMDALHEDTNRVESKKGFEQNYDGTDIERHAIDYDRKQKQFASSPIAELFNIRTVSVVRCCVCRTSSATFEEMSQISLELEDSGFQQLNTSLQKHFKQEKLVKDCKWNCPECRRPQEATRDTYIWKLPQTLVIHFKRFSQCGSYDYVKNDANVSFDFEHLSLENYLHPEASKPDAFYSLFAITNHTGSLNSGHYTSVVRKEHKWYKYDDDYVSEVSRDSISSSKAFVLFYTLPRGR